MRLDYHGRVVVTDRLSVEVRGRHPVATNRLTVYHVRRCYADGRLRCDSATYRAPWISAVDALDSSRRRWPDGRYRPSD